MKNVFSFFKSPRNIYFSIIVMLTVVTALASISFSYYVDESRNDTKQVSLSKVDNRIHSDNLNNGKITLIGKETKVIDVYIMSNNEFESSYKLFYKADSDVKVNSLNDILENIDSKDIHKVSLELINNSDSPREIEIGIKNGYVGNNIVVDDNLIVKK